jgi:uncharacterized repeat protein (TIGR03837 family)
LLDALQTSPRLVHLLVPEGRITSLVQDWLGEALTAGQPSTRGQLCVQGIPFLPQPDYDRLLWCADFNCVRGEDSLVRALWAARPLLWQCYPQAENGHLVKMQALLDLYLHHLPEEPARLMASLWRAWNEGDAKTIQCCWPAWLNCLPELLMSAHHYASVLNSRPDLARQLLQFHAELL